MTFTRAGVEQTVHRRFEHVVARGAARVALTGDGRAWTYGELNDIVNRIAHGLRARAGTETTIAYLLDLSPAMVIATMAVIKAGRAYLAIHPAMPAEAQAEILREAAPAALVTSASYESRARAMCEDCCPVLLFDELAATASADNPDELASPRDPATVFFTSGTSGRPKGVVRSHRAVLHRAWLSTRHEGVTKNDRQSLLTHCSFGASQADLMGALLTGATLAVFDVVAGGLSPLADWIDRERITLLRPPVQLFRRLLAGVEPGRRFDSVRLVSLGGEHVTLSDIEAWRRHFPPGSAVLHRFSTTETSLLTACRIDHRSALEPELIAAGHPVEDKLFTLVDQDGRRVGDGETGELVVASDYLADGYWNRPVETARAFGSDPARAGLRAYRTGDRGRMLPDGRFVLLGRLDQQVKIRGYRVDLGEIEAVLRTLPGVSDAAAAASQGGEARIHAWLVTSDGTPIDPSGLRAQLRSRLPEWKIPSEFHQLDALPATANGKLDRQRLRALIDVAAGSARDSIGADSGTPPPTAGDSPVGPIEQAVASLFERLLRCGPVSRASDFFLLGGDSLQATVLHQHLERELSVRLPLQALVKDATVRGIADAVHREQRDSPAHGDGRPPLLVPLRPIGAHEKSTRPLFPLFFVHGRLGQAFVSPHMLEAMGADQPVYAFQIPGLDRRRMARNSIQEMARAYIEGMRGVQPDGPYFLGSACGGALVAVEMAIQLRRAGVAVGPILMVDPPVAPVGESAWWYRSLFLARAYAAGLVPRAALARRLRLTMRRRAAAGLATLKFRDSEAEQRAADAVRRFAVARLKYRNWRYDGPVLMLRSSTRLRLDGPDRRGPFSRHLVGDIEWFDVGGDHDSVRHPANDATARHLRTAVQTAQRALADLWRRSTTG